MAIQVSILGLSLEFETDKRLFSPSAPDRGTMAMLSLANFRAGMRVLDLGCGWGLVGSAAAKICGAENVCMADIDPVAVEIARTNLSKNGIAGVKLFVSDGLRQVDEAGFDIILSNPPYQSDFSVAKHFIEKGFNRLKMNGRFLMVTKRREWYKNKLISVFGGVKIHEIDGYFVFEAEKRHPKYYSMHS